MRNHHNQDRFPMGLGNVNKFELAMREFSGELKCFRQAAGVFPRRSGSPAGTGDAISSPFSFAKHFTHSQLPPREEGRRERFPIHQFCITWKKKVQVSHGNKN